MDRDWMELLFDPMDVDSMDEDLVDDDRYIPQEIIMLILSFISNIDDLITCRLVCSYFARIIDQYYVRHGININGTSDDTYHTTIANTLAKFPKISRLYLYVSMRLDHPLELKKLSTIELFSYVINIEQPFDCNIVPRCAKQFYLHRTGPFQRHGGQEYLQNIRSLPPLVHLEIHQYNIPPSGIACFPSTLEILHLQSAVKIETTFGEEFEDFARLTNLKTLSLCLEMKPTFHLKLPASLTHLMTAKTIVQITNPLDKLIYLSTQMFHMENCDEMFKNLKVLILNNAKCLSQIQFVSLPKNLEHLELANVPLPENVFSLLPPRLCCLNIDGCNNTGTLYELPASIRSLTVTDTGNNIETISDNNAIETLTVTNWKRNRYIKVKDLPIYLRDLNIRGEVDWGDFVIKYFADCLANQRPLLNTPSFVDNKLRVYGCIPVDKHVKDMDGGLLKTPHLEYLHRAFPVYSYHSSWSNVYK